MTAAIFCLSVLAIVAIGCWAIRTIRRGVQVRAEAIEVLDCGCSRGSKVYTCLSCGDERCYTHQNGLCCEERISDHEHDPEAAETDAHFAADWEAWELELKETAE